MSELAFDEHGQHFHVPDEVVWWRIRRFNQPGKPGGAQVVYGDDSLPLFLDVNTTAEEFREAVGGIPGRYRLDGVDVRKRPVNDVPPVYLVINGPVMAGSVGAGGGYNAPPPASTPIEYALVEVVRANAEAVKSMADKFSGVCESVAKVLAAADGAALPRRAPLGPLLLDEVDRDDDEDDDDDERNAAPPPAAQPTMTTVLTQVLQMVKAFMEFSSGGNSAKVGAVMGQVVETAKVVEALGTTTSEPSATPTTDEPTDEHGVRATASANVSGTHVGNGTHATSGAPREPARARPSSAVAGHVASTSAPATHVPATSSSDAVDPMAHFGRIMAALTPEEQAHVQYVVTRLSVLDLMEWYKQLAGMTVAEGAEKIRAELARVPTEENAA